MQVLNLSLNRPGQQTHFSTGSHEPDLAKALNEAALTLWTPVNLCLVPCCLVMPVSLLFSRTGPHYPIAGCTENISHRSDTCHQLFSLAWWDRFVVPQSLLQRLGVKPGKWVCVRWNLSSMSFCLCSYFVFSTETWIVFFVSFCFPDSYMVSTQ